MKYIEAYGKEGQDWRGKQDMNFGISSLCETLARYQGIIIYGTGCHAKEIYPCLVQGGLKDKILCFTQTDKCAKDSYENVPIIAFDELECDKTESVVLIATSEVYVNEINGILSDRCYFNIVSLADYLVDPMQNEQKFCTLDTFDEYCEAIVKWYLKTHADKTDKKLLFQELKERGESAGKKKDSNLIVIINGHISIRSNKIIGALKKKGYQVIMLNYYDNNQTWCCQDLMDKGITVYRCQYVEEMLYKALQYDPLIYLFEPRWGDCTWANIMLKNKKYFGRIVLSLYDTLNEYPCGQPQNKCDMEKYALENADGIIWKWFSEDSMRKRGFCFSGKSILFPDYCSASGSGALHYEEELPGALKLCMVVGIDVVLLAERTFDDKYISLARLNEILEKIGNREDCVFHLYLGKPIGKYGIEAYRQYEDQYKNFKVYFNTERSQLMEKLREYDYACNIYTAGEIPPDNLMVDDTLGSGMKNYCRNSFSDYISAGLPMIATMPQKYIEYMQKYNVIVKMNLSNLDIDYLKKHKDYYKKNTDTARKELDIDKQIGRLIDFFYDVSSM